jgi:20S proteasome alpha/beta subunit
MTYTYGFLDTLYRYDMSLDKAIEFVYKAIYHVTNKDTGSEVQVVFFECIIFTKMVGLRKL